MIGQGSIPKVFLSKTVHDNRESNHARDDQLIITNADTAGVQDCVDGSMDNAVKEIPLISGVDLTDNIPHDFATKMQAEPM